jgi:Uma2 family endonuclease
VGPPTPVVFPVGAEVPESQLQFELRVLLYQLLCDHLGLEATIGSDQFVYYDAAEPRRCLAPDVFVQLKPSSGKIRSWKVWERGAPELAVEIVSPSDAAELPWEEKLSRYQSMGVAELVRFDVEAQPGEPMLRIWDRVEGALLERELTMAAGRSSSLDVCWVVAPADEHASALRITVARDSDILVPTRLEAKEDEAAARQAEAAARQAEATARQAEATARQAEATARQAEATARQAEATARQAAEARIRELEAELRRRS